MKSQGELVIEWISPGPEETRQLGARLGRSLPPGAVVILSGTLGAGKTTLVQGIAAGLGIREHATSPTFVLAIPYSGDQGLLYHVDAYRLGSRAEVEELGLDEWVEQGARLVVEWGERFESVLPPASLRIEIEWESEMSRRIRLKPLTPEMLTRLREIEAGERDSRVMRTKDGQ